MRIMKTTISIQPITYSVLLLILLVTAGCGSLADRAADAAQRGVERATEREVQRRADEATTSAIEGFENAVRCTVGDSACAEEARSEGRDIVYVDEEGNPVSTERNAPENVSANYDFVPGTQVLFEEDFSGDRIGDFPRRLRFVRGAMEVVDWNDRRLLRGVGAGGDQFEIPVPETLPDRFTLELEIHDPETFEGTGIVFGHVPDREDPLRLAGFSDDYIRVGFFRGSGLVRNTVSGPDLISTVGTESIGMEDRLVRIEVQVDGAAIKVFAEGQRITNVPAAELARSDAITVRMGSNESRPVYIGAIRVAAVEDSATVQ